MLRVERGPGDISAWLSSLLLGFRELCVNVGLLLGQRDLVKQLSLALIAQRASWWGGLPEKQADADADRQTDKQEYRIHGFFCSTGISVTSLIALVNGRCPVIVVLP